MRCFLTVIQHLGSGSPLFIQRPIQTALLITAGYVAEACAVSGVTPAMRAASLANCTKTPTIYRWLKRYKRDGEQTALALIPLAQLELSLTADASRAT